MSLSFRPARATVAALLSLAALTPSFSQAGAMSAASVELDITLQGITNVTAGGGTDPLSAVSVLGYAQPFDLSSFAVGPGSTADAAVTLDPEVPTAFSIGDTLSMDGTSNTAAPLRGFAEAASQGDGVLQFENTSATDTFRVDLLLEYQLAVSAFADQPSLTGTDAWGIAQIYVRSDLFGSLLDTALESVLDFDLTEAGTPTVVDLTLGPGFIDTVLAFPDAASYAVPSPATLWLLASGLLAVRFRATVSRRH